RRRFTAFILCLLPVKDDQLASGMGDWLGAEDGCLPAGEDDSEPFDRDADAGGAAEAARPLAWALLREVFSCERGNGTFSKLTAQYLSSGCLATRPMALMVR